MSFKICVIGGKGVGKSTFINFNKLCNFITRSGEVKIEFIESTNGKEHSDGKIVMFDVTSKYSYLSAKKILEDFQNDQSVVFCANKVESRHREVLYRHVKNDIGHFNYSEISNVTHYNILKPVGYLIQRFTNENVYAYTNLEDLLYICATYDEMEPILKKMNITRKSCYGMIIFDKIHHFPSFCSRMQKKIRYIDFKIKLRHLDKFISILNFL